MLLSNPLASPFLPTLGVTFVSLFGASLLALVFAARRRSQALASSVLFQRWRTWIVIAPLFSLAALSGPLALALFAAALAVQGSREYAHLAALRRSDTVVLIAASIGLPLACVALSFDQLPVLLIVLPLLASLPALLQQDTQRGPQRLTTLLFGLWYVPLSLALLVLLDHDAHAGPGLVLALALGVALSDVGAFTAGRLWGHTPLAPRLSPSKTWAGLIGNIAGAALGLVVLRPLAPEMPLLALVAVVAAGAVWGDLLESLLKRAAGAKDTGAWLPGFGGLLDRVDSLLVVLPLALVVVRVSA